MKNLTALAALLTLGISASATAESTTKLDPVVKGGRGVTAEGAAEPARVPSGGRGLEGQGAGITTSGSSTGAVDINTASKATLKSDLGLTEAEASAVIRHREKNGPLTSAAQLDSVSGLDSKVASRIKGRLEFGADASGPTATP